MNLEQLQEQSISNKWQPGSSLTRSVIERAWTQCLLSFHRVCCVITEWKLNFTPLLTNDTYITVSISDARGSGDDCFCLLRVVCWRMSNSNREVPNYNCVCPWLRGIRRQAVPQLIQLCRRGGHLPARPLETIGGGQWHWQTHSRHQQHQSKMRNRSLIFDFIKFDHIDLNKKWFCSSAQDAPPHRPQLEAGWQHFGYWKWRWVIMLTKTVSSLMLRYLVTLYNKVQLVNVRNKWINMNRVNLLIIIVILLI